MTPLYYLILTIHILPLLIYLLLIIYNNKFLIYLFNLSFVISALGFIFIDRISDQVLFANLGDLEEYSNKLSINNYKFILGFTGITFTLIIPILLNYKFKKNILNFSN